MKPAVTTRFNAQPPPASPSTTTVLRYPGGKSRAVHVIKPYLPKNLAKLCSPFLGGASFELSCAADGIEVIGADAFAPVINFWHHALQEPALLANTVRTYHPLSRTRFYQLQKSYKDIASKLDQAAVFFVLNRSSFSGTTLSGGMSPGHPRFTESAITKLSQFKSTHLRVACADYTATLAQFTNTFLYLDPPYANGGKLYGKKGDMHAGFDHQKLAHLLAQRDGWILSYNDCELIRDLYRRYTIIEPEWTYGMSSHKKSQELLIVNV